MVLNRYPLQYIVSLHALAEQSAAGRFADLLPTPSIAAAVTQFFPTVVASLNYNRTLTCKSDRRSQGFASSRAKLGAHSLSAPTRAHCASLPLHRRHHDHQRSLQVSPNAFSVLQLHLLGLG